MKWETNGAEKSYTNTDTISKSYNKNKPTVKNRLSKTVEYFLLGPSFDSDKKRSAKSTQWHKNDFEDVFNGIGCFDGIFSLQLKPDSKPYQAPSKIPGICTSKTLWGGIKQAAKIGYNSTF